MFEEPMAYGRQAVNQDGLWKKVIGELFEDFLLFFAPELHQEVDFSKAPDFLQQELFQEILDQKKGTTYADQIVKVRLKNGEEQWILVHIEVEGSADTEFPKRMFKYFYRIFDKYHHEIVAFAVFTDAGDKGKSSTFTYSYFGTTLDYTYNIRKVSDYDEKELSASHRLFSKVVLATKYMHETKSQMNLRYRFKIKLIREILRLEGHSRMSISAVFYFVDYLLRLPKEFTHQLTETIRPILEEERTDMVQFDSNDLSPTLAELAAIERKEALEQGIVQGTEKSKKHFALTLLGEGFDVDYIAKLAELDVEEVMKLKKTSN